MNDFVLKLIKLIVFVDVSMSLDSTDGCASMTHADFIFAFTTMAAAKISSCCIVELQNGMLTLLELFRVVSVKLVSL